MSIDHPGRPLNILQVTPGYKPGFKHGGPVISVASCCERLVQRGHRVVVFTTNSNVDDDMDVETDRPVIVDGVEVWYFRREEYLKRWLSFIPYLSRSMGWHYAPTMARELCRIGPSIDVVHTQMPFVYPTFAGALAARRFGKPLFYGQRGVLDPHRLQFRKLKKRLYIALVERWILRQATVLIALTEIERDSYQRLGLQTYCRVVPNGIDVHNYRVQPAGPLPDEWGIPPSAPVILFLGRLHQIKGLQTLLEAFIQIVREFPAAILVLAGPNESNMEDQLRRRAADAGLADRVKFTGMVTGENKLDLLARADLFCLPSAAEGFSVTILEALASATPVLISPGCYFPEVEVAGAGKIVDTMPGCIAAAMTEMLSRPDRLREMGLAGRAFAAGHFTWERVVDILLSVYSDGIDRYRRIERDRHADA